MQNILFVHPYKIQGLSDYSIMSMGSFAIANNLISHGNNVIVYNAPMEISINKEIDVINNIQCIIDRELIDITMISLQWYEHYLGAIEIAREIKLNNEKIVIIMGGITASLLRKQILSRYSFIDYIVFGDAEYPVESLVEYLNNNRNASCPPNVAYIDSNNTYYESHKFIKTNFNFMDYTTIDCLHNNKSYLKCDLNGYKENNIRNFWLLMGMGCKYDCTYCGGSKKAHKTIFGRECFIARNIDNIKDDISKLKTMAVEQISFSHDFDFFDSKYQESIFRRLSDSSIKLYYESFQIPSNLVINNLITNNVQAHIAISALTGSFTLRKQNGKHFDNSELILCIKKCIEYGVEVSIFFSLNLENQVLATINETITLINKIKELNRNIKIIIQPILPFEIASKQCRVSEEEFISSLEEYLRYKNRYQYFIEKEPILGEYANLIYNQCNL